MPSIFPDLLTYGFLATFVLRVTVGLMFLYTTAYMKFLNRAHYAEVFSMLPPGGAKFLYRLTAGFELAIGIMLIVGIYLQAAALVAGLLLVIAAVLKWRRPNLLPHPTALYVLLAIVSLSLLFLGPGAFAFDLPL